MGVSEYPLLGYPQIIGLAVGLVRRYELMTHLIRGDPLLEGTGGGPARTPKVSPSPCTAQTPLRSSKPRASREDGATVGRQTRFGHGLQTDAQTGRARR